MSEQKLKVYLFNVGAGDHIMLEFPDGSLGIIDCFFTYKRLHQQEAPALTYLKYLVSCEKVKSVPRKVVISFLCISHADSDHVKEIEVLFKFILDEWNYISLENLWLFGGHSDDITQYKKKIVELRSEALSLTTGEQKLDLFCRTTSYIESLEKIDAFKNIWRERTNRGEHYFTDFFEIKKYGRQSFYNAYSLGPISKITNNLSNPGISALLTQLFEKVQSLSRPLNEKFEIDFKTGVNVNSISAILAIKFGKYNLIFAGDATKETIEASLDDIPKRIVDSDGDLFNPNFIKTGHHGAKSSTSPEIWKKLYTCPKGDLIIGISAGAKHAHPHAELFNHLADCCQGLNIGFNIYTTNQCSDCSITNRISGEIDLDKWFQYHGCPITDKRVSEAFHNESLRSSELIQNNGKNLLAYIFEFPETGAHENIEIYKGVSNRVGCYDECLFETGSERYYCKGSTEKFVSLTT